MCSSDLVLVVLHHQRAGRRLVVDRFAAELDLVLRGPDLRLGNRLFVFLLLLVFVLLGRGLGLVGGVSRNRC